MYEAYLPHINATEGIKRMMNNKKLYIKMLEKFKLQEMADKLLEAIESGDAEKIGFAAHALKGSGGNLGFPTLSEMMAQIESDAKAGVDVSGKAQPVKDLVAEVLPLIEAFKTQEA